MEHMKYRSTVHCRSLGDEDILRRGRGIDHNNRHISYMDPEDITIILNPEAILLGGNNIMNL
jgi:hypothetical protein